MSPIGSRVDVTVAITTYRATEYLEKCLRSVAAQTSGTRRIEVLCVDDGSDDDTVDMAKALMKSLGLRGEVSTHPNTGTPAAGRNAALDSARGKYIYFVDCDDYLGPRAIESMLGLAKKDSADVVIGKFVGVRRGVPKYMFRETLSRTNVEKTSVLDSMNVLKMYRTSYARSLGYRFNPAIVLAEDHPFAMAGYVRTDRIAIQADADCYYCVRHDSASASAQHLTGHVRSVKEFYAYFYEVFSVLDSAGSDGFPFVDFARDKYWNRLFTFDLVREMGRRRDAADREASIAEALSIAQAHGGMSAAGLSAKAKAMRRALQLRDVEMVEHVARILSR